MNAIDIKDLTKAFTHRATLNGTSVEFHSDDYETVVGELVEKHGPGVPTIEKISDVAPGATLHPVVAAALGLEIRPTPIPVAPGAMNVAGRERSEEDLFAARAAGFSPAETVYARGSQVVQLGVDNARLSRQEWEARPAIKRAALDFVQRIKDEKRRDLPVDPGKLRMASSGRIVGPERQDGSGKRDDLDVTEHGFKGLVNRMGLSGGATYLASCWPALRATNVNNWAQAIEKNPKHDDAAGPFLLRTRMNATSGRREVFAAVSKRYAPCDVDQVVAILADEIDETARAEIVYDGRRVKATAVFHSNVQPEHYVAGEFFKAGVIVRSADDGSGGVKISAVLFQNLCLNLIIVDEEELDIARIIHAGDVSKVAERVREAVKTAREKIAFFVKKWDLAVEDDLLAELRAAQKKEEADYVPLPVTQAIRGLYNGLIEKQLVPLSKKNREETLNQLEARFLQDGSAAGYMHSKTITRAGVVNALTEYAHASGELDAFECYDLEKAASKLLGDVSLPFVPEVTA